MDVQVDSAIYDDDLNERQLPSIIIAHLGAGYALTEAISLKLSVRNIFDQEVLSALSADGLETLAQPRSAKAALQIFF